jgi:hypothetical protein
MLTRLHVRLSRLEARCSPEAIVGYTHPAPPPAWWAEVFRILHDIGYLHETLAFWGVPEPAIAAIAASLEERSPDA